MAELSRRTRHGATTRLAIGVALLAASLTVAATAVAQDPPTPKQERNADGGITGGPPPTSPNTPPQGTASRESMWRAPTAEDWAKPCLLTWQRTWDDALAVSKETGRPIMICVNMDGEIASEHYAGVRYRQEEIAKLYEPYVTVIASVYRHTPRDYDDQGHRIPCPRFGGVTCGEHIAIEPLLFDKYFDGQRISPRHLLIGLDEKESFDVYYANDTASVFKLVEEGAATFRDSPPPLVRSDRKMPERVTSRDVRDRVAVEKAYEAGDGESRKALLQAALKNGDAAQIDLLRLAVFGFDADLSNKARDALAKTDAPQATNLISDALRVPMDAKQRDQLISALERLGSSSRRAQWLSVVHRGLADRSTALDVEGWTKARAQYEAPTPEKGWNALEMQRSATSEASRGSPEDPILKVAFAEACLALGMGGRTTSEEDARTRRMVTRQMFDDALRAAKDAAAAGAPAWRTNTVLALASYYGGDVDIAYARATDAVKELPAGESSWNTMAVLTVFAEARFKAIKQAVKEKKRWPPEWLADLNAAYLVLLRHPLANDGQIVWHHDFLEWLGANDQASRFLDEGITRFATSAPLHERFRKRVLERRGVDALEDAYATMLAQPDAKPGLQAFAAVASTVAGDFQRRAGQRDRAIEAYGRAITRYDQLIPTLPEDDTARDNAAAAIAMAHAGRARLYYEQAKFDLSLTEIVSSFTRSPASAGTRDGVGFTPGETAQVLMAKLMELKQDDGVATLNAALAKLDPELLRFDRP